MIDFHCHLDLFPDPVRAVAAAREADLYVLSVTTTPKAFIKTAKLASGCKKIKTALGLHPEIAHERKSELPLFDRLITETRYVGEVGLDGSRDYADHFDDQKVVFNHILSTCSKVGGRILSIHSRNAATKVLDALERHPDFGIAVLHWFSGTPSQLQRATEMGCWFSVGAPMVKSAKGRELISQMPMQRVLTETDAPFTSKPGGTYSSAEVNFATEGLAAIWGKSIVETNRMITENLKSLLKS
ncbi:TatD family deoxyribonuclease [Rhizobium leguminosarum]|uniref:Qat anti-phage system TatD family nuclease QatD n=1 Tax=Rhizobium leguminosarum TaxID=384 RepID=UPI0013C11A29|nr:Qat anti-phage system TatD family nuclease QatD [Rhizobium leguminosarum]NEH55574.1 TatD family deoxyribonuclease [Rhizobium leguminosarum]